MQMQIELGPPVSVCGVKVCKRAKGRRTVIFYTSSTDLSAVKEGLVLEELPSTLWLPAESRCFMYTRLTIVVSLQH